MENNTFRFYENEFDLTNLEGSLYEANLTLGESEMTSEQWKRLDADGKLEALYNGIENQSKRINLIEETLSQMADAIENLEKGQKEILNQIRNKAL